mgnify:FL=1
MKNKIDKKTLMNLSMKEEFQDYFEKAFPVLWDDVYTKAVAEFIKENKGKYYHISDRMLREKTTRAMMIVIPEMINIFY